MLTAKINTYFATLIVTVIGAGAALIIMHVAEKDAFAAYASGATMYEAGALER
jgi:hypothetical protein